MTNPCVFVTAPGRLELRDIEVPQPGRGQVLIRGTRSLISTGTELTHVSGDFPPGSVWDRITKYPTRIGYSHVGVVEQVGEGVEHLAPGDRVLSWASQQRWATAGPERLFMVPDEIDDVAASFGTLGEIVLGGVRQAQVTLGESVVVLGVGLLGQLCAQMCRLDGGRPVIALDLIPARRGLAVRLGAHLTFEPTGDALVEAVHQATGGGADVVFDVTGSPGGMAVAVKLARRMGRVLLLGSPRGPVTIDFHDEIHSRSLRILGTHNSSHPRTADPNHPWTIERDVDLFFRLVAQGDLAIEPLVSHVHPWHRAVEVYQAILADRSGVMGVVFDWTAPGPVA